MIVLGEPKGRPREIFGFYPPVILNQQAAVLTLPEEYSPDLDSPVGHGIETFRYGNPDLIKFGGCKFDCERT